MRKKKRRDGWHMVKYSTFVDAFMLGRTELRRRFEFLARGRTISYDDVVMETLKCIRDNMPEREDGNALYPDIDDVTIVGGDGSDILVVTHEVANYPHVFWVAHISCDSEARVEVLKGATNEDFVSGMLMLALHLVQRFKRI